MQTLTERQQAILNYLQYYFQINNYWPSLREIKEHFKFKSTNGVNGHIKALINKKYLTKVTGSARAYRLNSDLMQGLIEVVEVPVYGAIAAGYPDYVESAAVVDKIQVDIHTAGIGRSKKETFALKVFGDSMIDAGIQEGDVVILEKRTPKDNDIVAALIDHETTLKRFIMPLGSMPYLKAENKHYPQLYPINELLIQGVAKAVIRHL